MPVVVVGGTVVSTFRATYFGRDMLVWEQMEAWRQLLLVGGARPSFLYTWLSRLVEELLHTGGVLEQLPTDPERRQVISRIMDFMVPALSHGPIDAYWEFVQLCLATGASEAEIDRVFDMQRARRLGTGAVAKRGSAEREVVRRTVRAAEVKAEVAAQRKRASRQSGFKRIFGAVADATLAAGPDAWKRFTPAEVDYKRCLGRTWNNGAGGQCSSRKVVAEGLCASCQKRLPHGKVTGEIPEPKLGEFLRHATRRAQVQVAAGAGAGDAGDAQLAAGGDGGRALGCVGAGAQSVGGEGAPSVTSPRKDVRGAAAGDCQLIGGDDQAAAGGAQARRGKRGGNQPWS